MVGIDASKPARLGAVHFLELDHHVHHLLDREVPLVVAERHVRLGDLLALAVEPDTGKRDLRTNEGSDVQLLLSERNYVVLRIVPLFDGRVPDVHNLSARRLEAVEERTHCHTRLVSVNDQQEVDVFVEVTCDTLRTGPGQNGVDDVGRVDVSAVLLCAAFSDRRARASSEAASIRASRHGARKIVWGLKNRKAIGFFFVLVDSPEMLSLGSDPLSAIVAAVNEGDLLPLALTCTTLRDECIRRAEQTRTPNGPRWHTCGTSSVERFKWAVNEMGAFNTEWFQGAAMTHSKYAAKNDNLDFLKWLFTYFNDDNFPEFESIIEPIFDEVCLHGHLDILWWLSTDLITEGDSFVLWLKYNNVEDAAANGHIHVLEFFRNEYSITADTDVCRRAAENGQLKVLQWIQENGFRNSIPSGAIAEFNGFLPSFPRSAEVTSTLEWNEKICHAAAGNGQLEILKWLRKNHCPWNETTCSEAARGGHLDILQWARANDCPWDEWTCTQAALSGHLHIIQWARQNGCQWNHDTCQKAAKGGHLHVLQWARENGCPWYSGTCCKAAKYGHLHILKWARMNGCDWNRMCCLGESEYHNYHDMTRWIESQPE